MSNKIIVCGGNGAGKSTVAKCFAQKLGWTFRDIEDYYFPVKTTDNKYATGRTGEEVAVLLAEDMKHHENLVLASVRGNHSNDIASMFTCAVVVEVPKEIRMKRVRDRAYRQFGDRILPGGDLREQQERFFAMVENRPIRKFLCETDTLINRIKVFLEINYVVGVLQIRYIDIFPKEFFGSQKNQAGRRASHTGSQVRSAH